MIRSGAVCLRAGFVRILLAALGFSGIHVAAAQSVDHVDHWEREFARQLSQDMPEVGIAGLAVALVDGEHTLFEAGYGLADIELGRAVTPETLFHVASVSKVVTGAALLMRLHQRDLQLDDDISPHLGFRVRNPSFPKVPITFRQLMTHRSSISDGNYEEEDQRFFVRGDPDIPLEKFLRGYLSAGGEWFSLDGSYLARAPGTTWAYSNVAAALAGHLTLRLANVGSVRLPGLFSRLGIRKASWTLAGSDRLLLATPYAYGDQEFHRLEHIGYPDWPAGLLRISVREFAEFMKIYTNRGQVRGERFLPSDTVEAALDIACYRTFSGEVRGQGLMWRMLEIGEKSYIGHPGGDPGAASLVVFNETGERAAMVFANTTHTPRIRPLLFRLAEDLLKAPHRLDRTRTALDSSEVPE